MTGSDRGPNRLIGAFKDVDTVLYYMGITRDSQIPELQGLGFLGCVVSCMFPGVLGFKASGFRFRVSLYFAGGLSLNKP